MQALRNELERFKPYDDLEMASKEAILSLIETNGERALYRDCPGGHITTSVFLVNKDHTKVLMCHHLVDQSWTWFGGHADGIPGLRHVASREVCEESGITDIKMLNDGEIAAISAFAIPGHFKRGKAVASHTHYDVAFIAEVDEDVEFVTRPEENSGIKWVRFDEMAQVMTDAWKCENVFEHIVERYFCKK